MGYLFRPYIYSMVYEAQDKEGGLLKLMDKLQPYGSIYRLDYDALFQGYKNPDFKSIGYFIHDPALQEWVKKVFTIITDNPDNLYDGNTIWKRKYDYDQPADELIEEFKEIWFQYGEEHTGWSWDDGEVEGLKVKNQIEYIVKGPWDTWTAY